MEFKKVKIFVFGVNLQNTLGLIRSMGEVGFPVILLLEPCIKSHCYVNYSKYVVKTHFLSTTEEAIDVLKKEYWNEKEPPIIYCGSDSSIALLDAHYNELKDKFRFFNVNSQQGMLNHYMDKLNQFPLAEKAGLTLIKTWHIRYPQNLPYDIVFPCLVKGNNSTTSTKGDMFICKDRNELESRLTDGVDYLIQEYIEKDYELNINGFSYNHGQNTFIPAVIYKIRDSLYRQGEYLRLDDINKYSNLNKEALSKFVASLGYEGIFSIELMCKGDKYYFLEINLRNDGLGYLYTAAGENYPLLWYKYVTGELKQADLNPEACKTPYYCMLDKDMNNIIEHRVSILHWIKDFMRSDVFYILDFKDIRPFVRLMYIHTRQACKLVLRKVFRLDIR